MARKIRVEFEGAIYHVMCRGDRRENIFEDDADRVRFLETLAQACQRTGWKIHAYVLMSNHYHWLLETPQPNLVAGMRWFQSCFTARYNRRHRKVGHLFQGRYKAMLVEPGRNGYFAAVADYIHLNPTRARLIGKKEQLKRYRWSSLPWYLTSPRRRPPWLEVSMVLGELGLKDKPSDRRAYGERLERRAKEGTSDRRRRGQSFFLAFGSRRRQAEAMARKIRVEFEGAIYHVMCRGDRRENIFEDDADRVRFLETLAQACQRTGWKIHAYVLMSNHYHWLLETPQPNLVAGMRWFQSCFTARYNRRHRKVGHLFQGRYKAMLVEPGRNGYFAAVADYIHLNPTRARLIGKKEQLKRYRWSSLPWYLTSPRRRPPWLEVSMVLGELGLKDKPSDRRAYGERLERRAKEGTSEEELKQMRRGWVLGGEAFRDRVLEWMEKTHSGKRPKVRREQSDKDHGQRHAEQIIQEMIAALGMGETELLSGRKSDWRKRLIAHRVRQETCVSLGWLARRLQMGSEGHVSRIAGSLSDLANHPGRRSFQRAFQRNARKKD